MWAIFQATDLPQAELLRHRLSEVGIESVVRNTFLQGAIGELPANMHPEVCVVKESQIEDAREIANEMEIRRKSPEGAEVPCPHCREPNPSNFELCWSCRTDLGGA